MWRLLSGIWMGWGLGSNDAANLFGTGVAANLIKYRTATILIAIFVTIGALIEGPKAMGTLGKLVDISDDINIAFTVSLAAAVSVTIMSYLGLPISTSQAVIGSLLGSSLVLGGVDFGVLTKVVLCWVGTPIGGAAVAFILYYLLDKFMRRYIKNIVAFNRFVQVSIILAGCYGAYSLGANNVANTTAVYVATGMLTPLTAALIGGVSIGLGAITFSRNVMITVGKKITQIGPLGALIATLSQSITLHFYTQVGVPVSSSQAIVGAVAGIGMVKGIRTISYKKISQIFLGWVLTPLSACAISYGLIKLTGLLFG
ncbi:MAG: inorganic phosphate transporter [Spirochaetota bacterium]